MLERIKTRFNQIIDFIVKYRFLISIIIFTLLVSLKISGSSIGYYDTILTEKNDDSISYQISGEARSIRSDEWLVMTPYNISQSYNNFEVNSNFMSLSGQNMIIGYNSPVKDLTILAKPISWGYLLLNPEYGLSWYWCGKMILFLLLSFELCMIITKKDKKLSLLGALLVSFGPATQWWFAPHMPDVILYFMTVAVFAYHLLSNESKRVKNLMTILLPFSLLGFVVALFPSFQVGLGYFLIILFITLMIRDKNRFYKNKRNLIRLGIVAILAISLVGYFLINNLDALKATASTAYPGARVDTGGSLRIKDLFTDLATPLLSYKEGAPYVNQSEDSTYIHFGVFIFLLLPVLYKQMKKKKDRNIFVGAGMALILVIFGFFMVVGFPTLLSKLTLFSYISPNRAKMIFGFISVLFTIWGFKSLKDHGKSLNKFYYLFAILIFALLNFSFIDGALKAYSSKWFYLFEIGLFTLILFLAKNKLKNFSYLLVAFFILFSSLNINPIITGTSALTNHPSSTFISEKISEDKDSYWLSYNSLSFQGYLLSLGVKTLNAVNFYPDFRKWEIIDPNKTYEENWNRYAHIVIKISTDENHLDNNLSADSINAYLTNETIYSLSVKYLVSSTNEDLSEFNSNEYSYEKIYSDSSVNIFQIMKR